MMENMAGFRSIKKPVIFEIPTIIIATPTGTDIPFLTKMQKRANPTELKLPFCNYKSSKTDCYGENELPRSRAARYQNEF